jgi:NADH:ubiquinone oxidoreductase subunit D
VSLGLLELVEKTVKATPHIGLLHRGTEKLIEYKIIYKHYLDFDLVSMLAQEHSYCLAVEINNCKIPERSKYIRVIFAEITEF